MAKGAISMAGERAKTPAGEPGREANGFRRVPGRRGAINDEVRARLAARGLTEAE